MRICSVGVVLLMVSLACSMPSLAKVYTVGDSAGWALNVDYKTWTSGKTFKVGDSLGNIMSCYLFTYDYS